MADPLLDTNQLQYWWIFGVLVFMIVTPWLVSLSNKKDQKRDRDRDREQEDPKADSKDSDLDLKK